MLNQVINDLTTKKNTTMHLSTSCPQDIINVEGLVTGIRAAQRKHLEKC